MLYARAGRAHCPECRLPVRSQTPEEIRAYLVEDSRLNAELIKAANIKLE